MEVEKSLVESIEKGKYRRVKIDSREVEEGDLFFALKGEKTDGHHFLKEAKARGAKGAVVSTIDPSIDLDQIAVLDPVETLQRAAKRRLERSKGKVFAVTGSVGKTTTKDFLASLLKERFSTYSTPKNHNTKLSLPMSLLNMPVGVEWFVLEMGMTHFGDIGKLVEIAPPDFALITKIAYAHAMNFSSIEQIARGKAQIFSNTKTKMGIIPEDFPCKEEIHIPWITPPLAHRLHGELFIGGESFGPFSLPGQHNCHNVSMAIQGARLAGLEDEEIKRGIPKLTLPAQRLELSKRQQIDFLNDSYNANKMSMIAALDCLSEYPNKRKIAVFGEMLELGEFSDEHHEDVGKHAIDKVDTLVCYGAKCEPMYQTWKKRGLPAYHFSDKIALSARLKELAQPGDLVLLKASRSNALWTLLDHFIPEN